MLCEMLARIALQYTYERVKPFAGSDFGNFVRHDLSIEAKKIISLWPFDLRVKSSVGAGNWAAVPWLAFFDPLETTSATSGNYVVFLINAQDQSVILSLNQGTTERYRELGQIQGRKALMRNAKEVSDRVSDFAKYFDTSAINLGSNDSLPLGYEAGHAFGRTYAVDELEENKLSKDLHLILDAYKALVDRGGSMPIEAMFKESGNTNISETRKYVLSRKIERSANVRKEVLSRRQPVCECCGFDPVKHFSYSGPVQNTPLDVHHAKPLNYLSEGETRRYVVPDDFLVLCPTCHRMIHKIDDPSNLKALKNKLRFKYMVDIHYPMF